MQYYRRTVPGSLPGKRRGSARISVEAPEKGDEMTQLPTSSECSIVEEEPARSSDPLGPMESAMRLVHAAASILDEEMAAGVLAAHDARGHTSGYPASSSGSIPFPSGQPAQDVRAAIDALSELLRSNISGRKENTEHLDNQPNPESSPVLRPQGPIQSGKRAIIPMKVHNDDERAAHLVLCCTDITNHRYYRIPGQHAKFTPNQVQLGPDATTNVTLEIMIPQECLSGTYSGLVTAQGLPYLNAVVMIDVENSIQ